MYLSTSTVLDRNPDEIVFRSKFVVFLRLKLPLIFQDSVAPTTYVIVYLNNVYLKPYYYGIINHLPTC